MSLLFSPPRRLEERKLLFPERHYFPPHSSILPEEGRWIPDIYSCANFYEKAGYIPHRDGQQVIIYWMPDECYNWRETAARGVKRLKKMYEKLDRNHPRIVRYASFEIVATTKIDGVAATTGHLTALLAASMAKRSVACL